MTTTNAGQPKPSVTRQVTAWAFFALLLYFLYRVTAPFLGALTWAAIVAIFSFPLHRRFCEKLPNRTVASLASVGLVVVLLVAPVAWLVPAFVSEAGEAIGNLPRDEISASIKNAASAIDARLPEGAGSVEGMTSDAIDAVKGRIGQISAFVATNVLGFFLDFIVFLLALFYLFRDGRKVVDLLRDVSPFTGERHDTMVKQAIDMISVTISSGFVTAAVQGALSGLTFAILGLPAPILWGVITALFAFLPFVGAWMVWLPAGVGLLLEGQTGRGIAMLAGGALIVSTVDNFLRPYLISDRSQMNALLTFVSVLGGMKAFGLLGIVLGPLTMAAAVGLLTGYRESLVSGDSSAEPEPVADAG